ncbi:MAG: hypothetical protein Q9190_006979 [Brigantiaea leucoxantha]
MSEELKYEAVSYTWGKRPFNGLLDISSGSIQVPDNLANALRELTPRHGLRYLWADAVCIDQTNVTEKNLQVAMMGEIFERAQRVLIWLGLGDEHTSHVFDLFRTLSSRADDYGVNMDLIDSTTNLWDGAPTLDHRQKHLLDNLAVDHDFRGIVDFYSNAWFERLWVVQEIALARDLEIHCGSYSIGWRQFMVAALLQYWAIRGATFSNWEIPPGLTKAVRVFTARWRHRKTQDIGLVTHMAPLRQKECLLDLDRIYALLHLRGPRDPQIYPDYTQSVRQVYTSTTEALMRNQMSVLAYAGIAPRYMRLLQKSINTTSVPSDDKFLQSLKNDVLTDDDPPLDELCSELPSWVADWRITGFHPSVLFSGGKKYSAHAGTVGCWVRMDPRALEQSLPGIRSPETILIVSAIQVDVIHVERGLSGIQVSSLEQIRTRVLEIKKLYNSEEDRILLTEEDALTVFARAIIADGQLAESREFIRKPWLSEDLVNLWLQFEATPFQPSNPETRQPEIDSSFEPRQSTTTVQGGVLYAVSELYAYRVALRAALRFRTFFITKKGYVGLAPAMVRKDDFIVIIKGVTVPMLLRRIPDSVPGLITCYLIGDCYVHGIMQGEYLRNVDSESLSVNIVLQ